MRDRLLNAAEQVVARQGVANLTLEAVAREAGVSKGGLLYHFPSKSALVAGIVDRLVGRLRSEQQEAVAREGTSSGAFTRAYVSARAEPLSPEEVALHSALLAAVGTDPQYLAPFHQISLDWQACFLADGIDPAVAQIVRLTMDGLCFCRLLGLATPEGDLYRQVIRKLQSMTQPEPQQD